MCYVRCKWSREVESCKKQTTVYRRQVRHSHFNFSQMMMIAMMIMMKMMLMMLRMIFGPLQTYKILHTGFKVFINISPSKVFDFKEIIDRKKKTIFTQLENFFCQMKALAHPKSFCKKLEMYIPK